MNKEGKPIGLEKIGFFPKELDPMKHLKSKMEYLLEAKEKLAH